MILKDSKEIRFIDISVLSLFFISCYLLFLSLVGWFNIYFVSAGLLFLLGALFVFRKSIEFDKKYFLFFILTFLLILGIVLFKGFFSGDATNYWLPLSKNIVLNHRMPDLTLDLVNFSTTRGPLLPLFFSFTFVFFPFREIFAIWIPVLFGFLTILLLYQWAKDKNMEKKYLFFIPLLFLANPIFFKYGWDILQEPLILFFFTSFFYFLERYEQDKNSLNLPPHLIGANFVNSAPKALAPIRCGGLFLIFISFVLAFLSKESAIFLSLPFIFYFFRHKFYKDKKFIFILLTFTPLIIWFLRNYLIFDNPVFPLFNSLFKGKYYEVGERAGSFILAPLVYENYKAAIFSVAKELLFYFPFIIFSLIQFLKEKKIIYLLTFALFVLGEISLPGVDKGAIKHYYPLLGLLIIYGLWGVQEIKSKTVLTVLFGLIVFGLFFTPFVVSSSPYIVQLENYLSVFSFLATFIVKYKFFIALLLSLYFYFFLNKKEEGKILILGLMCLYLIKTTTIQISWLNIWGPIFIFLAITLFWPLLKYKEKIIIFLLISTLIINSWGLALSYFLSHKKFVFPKEEAYGILPKAGEMIKQRENNNDFYTLVGYPIILNWRFNQKVLLLNGYTFNLITNLKYNENMSAKDIKELFSQSKIKYIVKNDDFKEFDGFYKKIKPASIYFELLYQEDDSFLWRVKE